MSHPTLRDLYATHGGKVSDKWSIYLDTYQRVFDPYRDQPVKLLEIGVQNGGSLEIWTRFFPHAEKLVGCDIDPACGELRYEDPRVSIVVGDANLASTEERIAAISERFDIVIDDGSHTSSDIVRSFARYFPRLSTGGVFVIEDLHCSYWREFGGGIYDPTASMNFLKRLADVINHEHWGVEARRAEVLATFEQAYGAVFDEQVLAELHSVEFVNSMCVLRKRESSQNELGKRHFSGTLQAVKEGNGTAATDSRSRPSQLDNPWSKVAEPPELQVVQLRQALADATAEGAQWRSESERLAARLKLKETHLEEVLSSRSWRVTAPLRAARKWFSRGGKE